MNGENFENRTAIPVSCLKNWLVPRNCWPKHGKYISNKFAYCLQRTVYFNLKVFFIVCINFLKIQMNSKAIGNIEKHCGTKLPKCVKNTLLLSGYDTLISLSAIDEKQLVNLEEHVNQNRNIFDGLDCCFSDIYRNQQVFRYVPGHKAIILKIPEQIKEILGKEKKSKTRKTKPLDRLISVLIRQLNKYPSKVGYPVPIGVISETNIQDIQSEAQEDGSTVHKCIFSCPFCDKNVPVIYKRYWWASNATKHLKIHVDEHLSRNA